MDFSRVLGYVPIYDEVKMKKSGDQAFGRLIPHLYQSFPVQKYDNRDDLMEGIWGLLEEVDAVIKDKVELASLRDAEPREQQQNWNSTLILIPQICW